MPANNPEAVSAALSDILKQNNLCYRMISNDVMLIQAVRRENILAKKFRDIEIRDVETNTLLPYAYVYCPVSNDALVADSLGILHVPDNFGEQSDTLIFSYVAYQDFRIATNTLKDFKTIKLERSNLQIDQIEVVVRPYALSKSDNQGAEHYETGRFDHFYKVSAISLFAVDPIRQLEWLPGISFSSNRSGIYFRGYSNDPMFYYDDIPVFRSDHFYSFISNANGLYYDEASVYANNLPLDKNRYCGGLIDLRSNAEDKAYALDISASNLISSAAGVIKLGNATNIHFAGRKSYFQSLQNENSTQSHVIPLNSDKDAIPLLTKSNPQANFSDFNSSIESSVGILDIKFSFLHAQDEQTLENYTEIKGPLNSNFPKFDYTSTHSAQSKTIGGSLQIGIQLKQNQALEITAARGFWETQSDIQHLVSGPVNDRLRNLNLANDLNQSEVKFAFSNVSKKNESWKIGIMHSRISSRLNIISRDQEMVDYENARPSYVLFGEKYWQFGKRWNAYTSLNLLSEPDYFSALPQVSLNFQATRNLKFISTWGLSSQAHSDLLFVNPFEENISLFAIGGEGPIEKMSSSKASLGLEYRKDWFELDIEYYYSHIDGVNSLVPEFIGRDQEDNSPANYKIQKGESKSTGLNVKSCISSKNWSFLMSYSFTDADNRFNRIYRGNWFTSPFEQKHQINGMLSFEAKNHRISISNSFKTGTTYNNLSGLLAKENRDLINAEDLIDQLPNYNSLDISYEYKLPFSKSDVRLQFSLLNALNRKNISSRSQLEVLQFSNENKILLSQESEFLPRTYQISLLASFLRRKE